MSRRRSRGATLCPTPSKMPYADVKAAREAYEAEARFKYRTNSAAYAYRCRCRAWHRSKYAEGTDTVALDAR